MFRQVSDLANMPRPVTTALDLGQRDKTTIADACNIFMNLLNEPVLQDHRNNVQKRFHFVIKPCHLVACMGAGLTLDQIETVKEWLSCKDEAFLPAAIAFQAEATPFPASFFTARGRASNPVTWHTYKIQAELIWHTYKILADLIWHTYKSQAELM